MMGKLTGRDLVIVRDPSKFRLSERMHLIGDNGKITTFTVEGNLIIGPEATADQMTAGTVARGVVTGAQRASVAASN